MTHFQKENSLLLVGGRNDRLKSIFNDIWFLTLDTLTWIKIDTLGDGAIARAAH
jgi:hypothetical protein